MALLCFKKGANKKAKDKNGSTSLHWASLNNDLNVVEYLVEHSNVNIGSQTKHRKIVQTCRNQLNLFRLIQSIQTIIISVLHCKHCDIFFLDGKNMYFFEFKQNVINKKLLSLSKG